MAILNLLLMHLIGRYCVFLSCVLLSWCSDARTEGCASCVLWAVFGFALGCRGLGEAGAGGAPASPQYRRDISVKADRRVLPSAGSPNPVAAHFRRLTAQAPVQVAHVSTTGRSVNDGLLRLRLRLGRLWLAIWRCGLCGGGRCHLWLP